jgi:hypothetical protein
MHTTRWTVLGLAALQLLHLLPYAGTYALAALLGCLWLSLRGTTRDWALGGLAALTLDAWRLDSRFDGYGWPVALAQARTGWSAALDGILLLAGAAGLTVAVLRAAGRPRSARALVIVSATTTAAFFVGFSPLWTMLRDRMPGYYYTSPGILDILVAAVPLAGVATLAVLVVGVAVAAGGTARRAGYALIPLAGLALLALLDVLEDLRVQQWSQPSAGMTAAPQLSVSIQVYTTTTTATAVPDPIRGLPSLAVGICLVGLVAAVTAVLPEPDRQ